MKTCKVPTKFSTTFPKLMVAMLLLTFLLLNFTTLSVSANEGNTEFLIGSNFLDQAWVSLDNGNDQLAFRHFTRAENHFSKALEINPDDIVTIMHHATANIGLREFEFAIEEFDKILELNPQHAPSFEGKALVYEMLGDFEQAQEMKDAVNAIYTSLASENEGKNDLAPVAPPSPDSFYSTWYASNAKHNFRNRFNGDEVDNASGFGCDVTAPWKADIENAVYFNLPWNTWGRYTEGLKWTGYGHWVNLSGNTQGYTNSGAFLGWTVPANENYVLLISETEVCAGFWAPVPSYFRISASYN